MELDLEHRLSKAFLSYGYLIVLKLLSGVKQIMSQCVKGVAYVSLLLWCCTLKVKCQRISPRSCERQERTCDFPLMWYRAVKADSSLFSETPELCGDEKWMELLCNLTLRRCGEAAARWPTQLWASLSKHEASSTSPAWICANVFSGKVVLEY